jgi:hypothetical protein
MPVSISWFPLQSKEGNMDFKVRLLFSVGLLCLLCLTLPSAARADNFTFSFTGTLLEDGQSLGTGTVTGEIYGLTNNATSAATDVTITGVPSLFAGDPNLTPPITNTFESPQYLCCGNPGANTAWVVTDNAFTETGGAITSSSFYAQAESQPDDDGELTFLEINDNISGALFGDTNLAGATPYFTDTVPLGEITFTPVSTPEPSSFSLMLLGLGSLGLMMVIRKRNARGHQATCTH